MGGIALRPHATQFTRPAPTSALEDSMLATQAFKLDLLTPVVKPAVVRVGPTGGGGEEGGDKQLGAADNQAGMAKTMSCLG
jgi:hypothetical protein